MVGPVSWAGHTSSLSSKAQQGMRKTQGMAIPGLHMEIPEHEEQCCAQGMPAAEHLLMAKGLPQEADLNFSYFLYFLHIYLTDSFCLIEKNPRHPTLQLKTGKNLPKRITPFPRGPAHKVLVAHFGSPRVLLTHCELCPAAQEELGGLGDGAVVGAAVWGMQVADVQAVGAVGPRLMDTKLVLLHIWAVCGFAQCVGK